MSAWKSAGPRGEPFEPSGTFAGTSAALEFAVTGLNVQNILVMGHGRCGGVQAFIEGLYAEEEKSSFIDRWMTLLHGAPVKLRNKQNDTSHRLDIERNGKASR